MSINKEYHRKYQEKWRKNPKRIAYLKNWRKKNKEKLKNKFRLWAKKNPGYSKKNYKNHQEEIKEKARLYKLYNPSKINAHKLVNENIRVGKLKKLPCVICGELKTDGHHEDYSKPLEVVWLCRTHHRAIHLRIKSKN